MGRNGMAAAVKSAGAKGFLLFALCTFALLTPAAELGAGGQDELDAVLTSAERFFQCLRKGNFSQAWSFLSIESRETVTADIYKASGRQYSKEQINGDLRAGGMIARSYWTGVLESFDPLIILEESRWEEGFVRPGKAELLITHRKSKYPVHLKLFKESGSWKVGMVESFWTRK
jgi:hypothetical protein